MPHLFLLPQNWKMEFALYSIQHEKSSIHIRISEQLTIPREKQNVLQTWHCSTTQKSLIGNIFFSWISLWIHFQPRILSLFHFALLAAFQMCVPRIPHILLYAWTPGKHNPDFFSGKWQLQTVSPYKCFLFQQILANYILKFFLSKNMCLFPHWKQKQKVSRRRQHLWFSCDTQDSLDPWLKLLSQIRDWEDTPLEVALLIPLL